MIISQNCAYLLYWNVVFKKIGCTQKIICCLQKTKYLIRSEYKYQIKQYVQIFHEKNGKHFDAVVFSYFWDFLRGCIRPQT